MEIRLNWNEVVTLKLEEDRCTCFSNSSFKSASVLRLSMFTWMSEGDGEEWEGCREEGEEVM